MDDTFPRNARVHIHPNKITRYLLSMDHPGGKTKARFFLKHGFDADSLSEALMELVRTGEIKEKELTVHGMKYVIEGEAISLTGSRVMVRSVWLIPENSGDIHFVTAYPGRRKIS